jgi:hypothetical protein
VSVVDPFGRRIDLTSRHAAATRLGRPRADERRAAAG